MKLVQLSPFAKARVWLGATTLEFASSRTMRQRIPSNPLAQVAESTVVLEVLVPRGARAEYGLLGLHFDARATTDLEVEVRYTDHDSAHWLDSLARSLDDVWLGLPSEYVAPVLQVVASQAASGFPSGRLEIVAAAHGAIGSSADVFRRLAAGVLSLMHVAPNSDEELKTRLKAILLD